MVPSTAITTVLCIVIRRSDPKVGRINASWIIARVQNIRPLDSIWPRENVIIVIVQIVAHAMRALVFTANAQNTVTLGRFCSCPRPTFVRPASIDLGPKTSLKNTSVHGDLYKHCFIELSTPVSLNRRRHSPQMIRGKLNVVAFGDSAVPMAHETG